MRMTYRTFFLVLFMIIPLLGVGAIDVELEVPSVNLSGTLKTIADTVRMDTSLINTMVAQMANNLETELEEDEMIDKYSNPSLLPLGFANASAAASHAGTQRSFIDYSIFALSVGAGVAASAPTIDPNEMMEIPDRMEQEGDLYAGLGFQPIVASLGINLSPLVKGLRANVKLGMLNIPEIPEAYNLTSSSFMFGLGASYQLVKSYSLPLGFIKWRGISLGSGFVYQKNSLGLVYELDEIEVQGIKLKDIGFTNTMLAAYNLTPGVTQLDEDDDFGTLAVKPGFEFSFDTDTYVIPLEINTGLRILYLLDVNFGAGIDLAMGKSSLSAGIDADVNFKSGEKMTDYVEFTPGSASLDINLEKNPQFIRPRITTGVMLNLGPMRVDIPLMLYFDSEGNTAEVGVNVAFVL